MLRCYFLIWNIFFCTEKPVDVGCVEEQLALLNTKGNHMELSINTAVNSCVLDSRGACAWHFGIDYCSEDLERWICHDGFQSSVECK